MRYTKRTRASLFRRVLLMWYQAQRNLNNYNLEGKERQNTNEKLRRQRDALMKEWEELK